MERSGGVTYVLEAPLAGAVPITFVQGHPQPQFSVGRNAGWRISGAGVLDVHGFLVFDGGRFFARSAVPTNPLLAEGQPLPPQWTPILAPCRLRAGAVELTLRLGASAAQPRPSAWPGAEPPQNRPSMPAPRPSNRSMSDYAGDREMTRLESPNPPESDPEPETRVKPSPAATTRGLGPKTGELSLPPQNPAIGRDNEMTRVGQPLPEAPEPAPRVAPPAMGSGSIPAPPPAPSGVSMPAPAPPTNANVASPQPERGTRAPTRRPAPMAGRLLAAGALVVAIVAGVFVVRGRAQRPVAPPPPPAPVLDWPEGSADAGRGIVVFPSPRFSAEATASATPPSKSKADAGAPPTLERIAVDAVHRGDLEAAAAAYEQLAAQHPENPAYARAAKTLRK